MNTIRGWISFFAFALFCYVIGDNRYLMKNTNYTVVAMLIFSTILVLFMNGGGRRSGDDSAKIDDGA